MAKKYPLNLYYIKEYECIFLCKMMYLPSISSKRAMLLQCHIFICLTKVKLCLSKFGITNAVMLEVFVPFGKPV